MGKHIVYRKIIKLGTISMGTFDIDRLGKHNIVKSCSGKHEINDKVTDKLTLLFKAFFNSNSAMKYLNLVRKTFCSLI